MPEEHNADETGTHTSVNRRRFVKALGAAGTAALGATGHVSAKGRANEKSRGRAMRSERVRSILSELNHPQLRIEDSQQFEIKGSDGKEMSALRFSTAFGNLFFAEMGDESGAQFRFDDEALIGSNELPQKYQNIPQGTSAALLGREDDVLFRRSATGAEKEMVQTVVEPDLSDAAVATGSDIGGFSILYDTDSENASQMKVHFDSNLDPSTTTSLLDQVSADQLSVNEVSVQWHNSCIPTCGGCVGSAASCYECYIACADAATGIGAVDCAICLYLVCRAVLIATCGACAHCVGSNL